MNDRLTRLYVRLRQRERGQTMAEYAVVLGIISVGILVALSALGGSISGQISGVASKI
ncbi:MAG: Flp/Fap pilin component [Gaiellales bacterium]|jgi:Flp pilus assembly pilin Flp|nr:Flp/Fap pilin component [Gaiellales bacterium]